jgi:beta-N-acetylhexosaminidase
VDQEGGPVERLTPEQCPGLPSFAAMARLGPDWVYQSALQQAQALRRLGFNLNFTPCLDVNTQPNNPVIGVRSFSANATVVVACANAVVKAYAQCGLMTVGKHFPGHGGGSVDSHEALPVLPLTAEHLAPFLGVPVPAVMLAHGYYAEACETPDTPASLSQRVIQGLLRQQMGFDGVTLTDDLQMGAIQGDPVEVAIQAMAAGNDILLYREAGEREWAVLQGVVNALQTGRLSIRDHHAALARITDAKERLTQTVQQENLSLEKLNYDTVTAELAQHVLQAQAKPALPNAGVTVVHPYTPDLHGYKHTPPDALITALLQAGLTIKQEVAYKPLNEWPVVPQDHFTVFVASHLSRCPYQHQLATYLLQHQQGVVLSLGWIPEDMPTVIQLPGYQPAAVKALASWLTQ